MPLRTTELRIFRPKVKIGQQPETGEYIWGHGEPVLQQRWERTQRELEMLKYDKNIDAPKYEWRDVQIVLEE